MKTKDLLQLEAYKLYASKPYDQVTFTELEKATGLSRGAILYHFKSKELLFNSIVENFILKDSSVVDLLNKGGESLLDFLKTFVSECKIEMQKYRSIGIYNMNMAKLHLNFYALSYYDNMQEIVKKRMDYEQELWQNILSKAVENNEIKDDLNLKVLAGLFVNVYQGTSFAGISRPKGYDITLLEKEFMLLYNLIKK